MGPLATLYLFSFLLCTYLGGSLGSAPGAVFGAAVGILLLPSVISAAILLYSAAKTAAFLITKASSLAIDACTASIKFVFGLFNTCKEAPAATPAKSVDYVKKPPQLTSTPVEPKEPGKQTGFPFFSAQKESVLPVSKSDNKVSPGFSG